MSTTTIRLPDDLKARITIVAEHAGISVHSFILQAITEKTAQEELHHAFDQQAEKRYANIVATGETIPWHDMRSYLESHLTDNPARSRPVARKLGR